MIKPNFLIIGAQKAGTTSVYHVLSDHPHVYMSSVKETRFFLDEKQYKKGLDKYFTYFKKAGNDKLAIGEASPGYICGGEKTVQRIKSLLPDAKLILTLRNPVERAYSQYWDNRRKLSEFDTFDTAINKALNSRSERRYIRRGEYMRDVRLYLKYFDREQLLILLFDDLVNNPDLFYKKIFTFLNLEATVNIKNCYVQQNDSMCWDNPFYKFLFHHPEWHGCFPLKCKRIVKFGKMSKYQYPPMSPITKKKLVHYYISWNEDLSAFLKTDLSHWNRF